ncbi:unnamed protein product [Meloidogyne enterolobii]|uniref:Uncharacterized protein n=1 Tax=Meloidogyne enterolobii TaxID=390850 RepID=A0ACB0YEE8_MELEN
MNGNVNDTPTNIIDNSQSVPITPIRSVKENGGGSQKIICDKLIKSTERSTSDAGLNGKGGGGEFFKNGKNNGTIEASFKKELNGKKRRWREFFLFRRKKSG